MHWRVLKEHFGTACRKGLLLRALPCIPVAVEYIHDHSLMIDEAVGPSCCVPNCEKEAIVVAAAREKGTTHPIGRRTLVTRKVSASRGAASVPDEVFHRAKDRSPVPPTARVVGERHIISVVPVTRVVMSHRDRSFTFYYRAQQ